MATIDGIITANPHRGGKPLDEPFDGYYSARRGTYRIIYRINEDKHTVEIYSIRHRRDAYRTLLSPAPTCRVPRGTRPRSATTSRTKDRSARTGSGRIATVRSG